MSASQPQPHAMEHAIARILRWGVVASGLLMLVGFVLLVVHGGSAPAATPADVFFNHAGRPIGERLVDPLLYLYGGILLLMCTPVVRVLATIVLFAVERDWHYVRISLVVLAIISLSLIFAFEL
jgi:uncharacterized membrane protein